MPVLLFLPVVFIWGFMLILVAGMSHHFQSWAAWEPEKIIHVRAFLWSAPYKRVVILHYTFIGFVGRWCLPPVIDRASMISSSVHWWQPWATPRRRAKTSFRLTSVPWNCSNSRWWETQTTPAAKLFVGRATIQNDYWLVNGAIFD